MSNPIVEEYTNLEETSLASQLAGDARSLELIEKLGLTEQKKLIDSASLDRFHFRPMTKLEELVFSELFPNKVDAKAFGNEVIPTRVLEIMEEASKHDLTKHLVIWHPPISKQDPLLIGRAEQYRGTNYLLARWGEKLLSFEELKKKAKNAFILRNKKSIEERLKQYAEAKANFHAIVENAFETGVIEGNDYIGGYIFSTKA